MKLLNNSRYLISISFLFTEDNRPVVQICREVLREYGLPIFSDSTSIEIIQKTLLESPPFYAYISPLLLAFYIKHKEIKVYNFDAYVDVPQLGNFQINVIQNRINRRIINTGNKGILQLKTFHVLDNVVQIPDIQTDLETQYDNAVDVGEAVIEASKKLIPTKLDLFGSGILIAISLVAIAVIAVKLK